MKPQWDAQVEQLSNAVNQWRATAPRLPSVITTSQGLSVTTEDVGRSLEEALAVVQAVSESDSIDAVMLGIHQAGVQSAIAQIASLTATLVNSLHPAHIDQITQHIWQIRASIVWLIPSTSRPSDMIGLIRDLDLESKLESLTRLSTDYAQAVSETKNLHGQLLEQRNQATAVLDLLKSHEREAANAKTNAEASSLTATTGKDSVAKLLSDLEEGIARHETLLASVNLLKDKAESTLESTSKVALAASFSDRKTKLLRTNIAWTTIFILGILGLVAVGFIIVLGVLNLPPILSNDRIEIGPLLTRLILVGPLVWLTWFSARQYGHTLRLIEDYAFKEASALAFVGYQREMSDDAEMIRLLRESAIKNFGNQPNRVFEHCEPVSPLSELLDKALEKGATDKFIDLIKALKPGK